MSKLSASDTFWNTLNTRPSAQDVQSAIQFSTAAAMVTALNAIIFAVSAGGSFGTSFLTVWTGLTLVLCVFVMSRARRASGREVTRVSARGARRVVIFSVLSALPWSVLALSVVGRASAEDQLLALLVCTGMSAGGTFILSRTLLAATAFYVTILGSVILACAINAPMKMLPIAVYTLLYGVFLVSFAHKAGLMARQRDRSLNRLSESMGDVQRAHAEISWFAFVDPVTGLPNRTALGKKIGELLENAPSSDNQIGVFLLDLDRFRHINDGIGHGAGDQLLCVVASRLKKTLGGDCFVARLWADEFAFVVQGLDGPAEASFIAARVISAVSEPATLEGRSVYPAASIGAALYPLHGTREGSLLRNADIALHRSKETGRGRYTLYREEMSDRVAAADQMERELHVALLDGQIEIHYQPKVALATGVPVGAEALVRWRHPENGLIPPDAFLALAAERGIMLDLTAYIFEAIGRDIVAWRTSGVRFGKIAVNIHPLDLKSPDTLIANLRGLVNSGVRVDEIEIEITEGCFVGRDSDDAALALDAINDLGFEMSLDDFGTGHASLSHLRKLPVQELKIDREFVTGICTNKFDLAIISATIEIARCLEMRIVAEGVETQDQIDALIGLGADVGQGYFWCRPVPRGEFEQFLRSFEADLPIGKVDIEQSTII